MTTPLTEQQRELADKNMSLVYAVINKMCKRRERSIAILGYDDACGVACMALCRAARGYDPSKGFAFSTYVYKVVTRAVRVAAGCEGTSRERHRNSMHTGRYYVQFAKLADGSSEEDNLVDCYPGADPIARIAYRDDIVLLHKLIGKLPPRQQAVIQAVDIGGTDTQKFAGQLGISHSLVNTRRREAKRRLVYLLSLHILEEDK